MPLRKIHLIAGLFFIFIFLATGAYMHFFHNHLLGMEIGKRMLYRSGHIYILWAAVMNVMYGYNYAPARAKYFSLLQILISALLLISLVVFTAGFFIEPQYENFHRPFSRPMLYLLFGFGIITGITGLLKKSEN